MNTRTPQFRHDNDTKETAPHSKTTMLYHNIQTTSVRMVRTSLKSLVALISLFFRLSTTVVEWVVVSLETFPLSFCELQSSWRSTTAELRAVMSCFITDVSS